MAEITAQLVKELRERTDAPMMECKKALTEANGDLEKAEEILRVRLGNRAAKASVRVTAEGVVGIYLSEDGKVAAMVELNCETDFVAKNEEFQIFARRLAELVARENPAEMTALSALPLDGSTVEEVRRALIGRIGENITIRRFSRIEAEGRLFHYVHGGGKIGVLLDLVGGDEMLGRDLAMHVAAFKPKAIDAAGVPQELIDSERRVAVEKAQQSGKPAHIVEKMVEGAVQKFLREVTLLGQTFVKDEKVSVEELLKRRGARVAAFSLFVVGEGIERRESNFAAEVAAAAAAAKG
ncbi:MAG: translation elongation factor Ts [Hydrogenophilus sp.]|nr:translation elongation factor Ts [Hydrogenophilus sp.]